MHSQRILRTELRRLTAPSGCRAFAEKIKLHPTALSLFLNGRRNVTLKYAEKHFKPFLNEETWEKVEAEYHLERTGQPTDLVALEFKTPSNGEEVKKLEDEVRLIGDGPLPATLVVLAERCDYQPTVEWICSQVPFSKEKVVESLERLARWGFLRKEEGKFFKTGKRWTIVEGNEPDGSVYRNARNEFLKIENKYFEGGQRQGSDYRTKLMTVHPRDIPRLKDAFREFMQKVEKLQLRSDAKQVYALTMSFFPVSK